MEDVCEILLKVYFSFLEAFISNYIYEEGYVQVLWILMEIHLKNAQLIQSIV